MYACPAPRPRGDLHLRPRVLIKPNKTTNVSSHATTADHDPFLLYQPPYNVSMLPSAYNRASAPTTILFGSSITRPAHSLSTLRNMAYPNATQDSLPAGGHPLPGGIDHPLGPTTRFQRAAIAASPLSKLPGARRVDPGGHPPESPTDPDVRISRIRLLELRIRCTTAYRVNHNRRRQRVAREQTVKSLPVHPCPL